jgi:selenocysteine lyase/cysteine desulfurase
VGQFLDTDWDIAVRTGLHCAPLAHQALGTAPLGTVRFSFGPANTEQQIERTLQALAAIAG